MYIDSDSFDFESVALGSNNRGTDQTLWKHRLSSTFVVRTLPKQVFSWCGSYKNNHDGFEKNIRVY